MRWAIGLEYDGSPFHGWQSQPHGNSVQDILERALARIAGMPVRATCAGRTDAGVHASIQVVHFDAPVVRPESAWVRGVNRFLPDSIAVDWAIQVAPAFHARFCAISRSYRYLLCNRRVRPGLYHQRHGWFHRPLNLAPMQQAAAMLVGEHDFSAFRAAECQARSPVKVLHQATVEQFRDVFVFEFRANAFLHHMVRNLVGALVQVGQGAQSPEWIARLLARRDRREAAATFPAEGLYLCGVEYEPRWQLPGDGRIMAPPLLAIP